MSTLYEKIKNAYDESSESGLPEDLYKFLTEASNPDNAEANELIRNSLSNAFVAYKNRAKLKDLGITVDYRIWSNLDGEPTKTDDFSRCELIGKNGRRLRCDTHGSGLRGRDLKNVAVDFATPSKEDERVDTLSPKSYKTSKEEVAAAKAEMPTLKRRLSLYERRYGKDSSQYKELVDYIKNQQRIIDKGVYARQNTYKDVSEDVDFKNYFDSKRMEDRSKPLNPSDVNPEVVRYKDAKRQERYNKEIEARNKQSDEEDAQRIADMAKRAAEDKSRRDAYLNKNQEYVKNTLDDIHSRIEAMKQRINGGNK